MLTLAALAVCAVTAAQARTRASAPILLTAPDEQPPEDLGLIALTVAEIKRLFLLVIRCLQSEAHHLHWVWWRRRHQAAPAGATTAPGYADKSTKPDKIKSAAVVEEQHVEPLGPAERSWSRVLLPGASSCRGGDAPLIVNL